MDLKKNSIVMKIMASQGEAKTTNLNEEYVILQMTYPQNIQGQMRGICEGPVNLGS